MLKNFPTNKKVDQYHTQETPWPSGYFKDTLTMFEATVCGRS